MADVTISNLDNIVPAGSSVIPISNGTQTGKSTIASLQVDYNSLTNKPTIPAAQVNADWNATSGVAQILNKPNLSNIGGGTYYNTAGTFTFIVPTGVTTLKAQVIGGGGGGRAGTSCNCGGTGGTSYIVDTNTLQATGGGCGFGGSASGTALIGGRSGTGNNPSGFGFYNAFGNFGGGGGGGVTCSQSGGNGGLAFGFISVTPGQTITVVVGAGGGGGCGTNPQGGYGCAGTGGSGAALIEW